MKATAGPTVRDTFSSRRDEWLTRAFQAAIPLNVTFELTRACNLRCVHCYLSTTPMPEVSVDRWCAVVSELAEMGCAGIALTGGELMLRDDWAEVARTIRARHLMLTVLTNGTLVDEAVAETIAALRPVRVAVSIYGESPSTHDRITGVAGSHEASLQGLRMLRARNVPCRVTAMLLRGIDVDELDGVRELATSLGCDFSMGPIVYPSDDGASGPLRHRVGRRELLKVFSSRLAEHLPEHGRLIHDPETPAPKPIYNCRAGISNAFVAADGSVVPCMGWQPSFGNVVTNPFHVIWTSEAARGHRRRMALPLTDCDACAKSAFCLMRCPKLAELEDGDMLGECSAACQVAEVVCDLRQRHQVEGGSEFTRQEAYCE